MILLDASVLVAYANADDENHARAVKVLKDLEAGRYGEAAVTESVFSETVTVLFIKLKKLDAAVSFGRTLLNACKLLFLDEVSFDLAFETFQKQRDTKLSFADCCTLACAKLYGASFVATFDEDFKKLKEFKVVS